MSVAEQNQKFGVMQANSLLPIAQDHRHQTIQIGELKRMNLSLRKWCPYISAIGALWTISVFAELPKLPNRESPIPATTDSVPHIQIGVEAVPEIKAELLHRVSKIPGVEFRATIVSLRGTTGFWLNEDLVLARPEVIVRGREFAHLHPDGSLHAPLSQEMAAIAVQAGWAVQHPWANKRPGFEGLVMIYTPGSKDELEVVFQLVMDSYRFVTGKDTALTD